MPGGPQGSLEVSLGIPFGVSWDSKMGHWCHEAPRNAAVLEGKYVRGDRILIFLLEKENLLLLKAGVQGAQPPGPKT